MIRTCRCADPLWLITTDGRKPIRCSRCGRRMLAANWLRDLMDVIAMRLAGRGHWRAAQLLWTGRLS